MDQCRKVSLLLEKNRKSIVSKGPSTASNKHSEAGICILVKSYGVMISSRTSMILVYTRTSSIAYHVLYVNDILLIENDIKILLPMRHGIKLSRKQSPKTDKELKRMSDNPYASAVGSIQYVVQCTRRNVAYALSVMSK
ncbi:UNVERIFIED_CONTAM: hypothetical protein Sradi_1539100 [Sesamum radiatum]|uniref:Reverse transcriptase Ty1/copia-type domain-containing protein n=1 Tax=Sesamum radiatum TaxID=300843 RepID=A0AAW2U917_SESRA